MSHVMVITISIANRIVVLRPYDLITATVIAVVVVMDRVVSMVGQSNTIMIDPIERMPAEASVVLSLASIMIMTDNHTALRSGNPLTGTARVRPWSGGMALNAPGGDRRTGDVSTCGSR
jgi:hypothetical protein